MSKQTPLHQQLIQQALVSHVIGTAPAQLKPAIVIWAKHQPRLDTLPLIALAEAAAGVKPVIYVDDTAARVFCGRTLAEQEQYNEQYQVFGQQQGCQVRFSSEVYTRQFNNDVLGALLELAQRTSVSRFVRCLPEKKTTVFDSLRASESMNMLLELLLFEQVAKECNALVVRHFTQGIVLSHQKVAKQPLPALVVPILDGDAAIHDYVKKIQDIYPTVSIHFSNNNVL